MNYVFAPGCALHIYKPHLSHKIREFLCSHVSEMELFLTCCQHEDHLPEGTTIINVCPGCNRRYQTRRQGLSTITLWEMLADSTSFDFPDYSGMEMTIHDPCPTRTKPEIHLAVRKILRKMNIQLIEPQHTMSKQKCCGDSFYPSLSVEEVNQKMRLRTAEMPAEQVCVYCVSCIKSVYIGGKTPRYLVDLLFNEETVPGTDETDKWHAELEAFIGSH